LCDDNTQRLPISRINDDYCDCRDGSDEPGTSACSHTAVQFHCVNAGYFSLDLPTSRVNDQLCDCCDGSDEYKRPSLCPNTCAELDAAYRREHAAQLALEAAGKNARVRLVQEAKQKKEQALRRRTDMEVELEEAKRQVELAAATKASEEKLESEEKRQAASAIRLEVATALGLNHASQAQLVSIILDILSSKENTILKDSYLNDNDVEEEATAAVVVPTFPLLKVISDAGVSISSALEADEAAFATKELSDYKAEIKRINLINAERRRKTKLKGEQKTADGTKTITTNEVRQISLSTHVYICI
jgi:protein kinase C substrate 80K-H